MAVETADVVVIGLGAVGSATLYRLALQGVRAVGIDRFNPPHALGSTHGESRITRLAVGEGLEYVPTVRRSHEIWRELEAETGETLFLQVGGLVMGPREGVAQHHGKADFVRRTIAVAEQAAVAHDILDADAIRARFPQFTLRGDEIGFYEPTAGLVFPERSVAVHLRLAQARGAKLHLDEPVTMVRQNGGHVEVRSGQRVVVTPRVILAAGAWIPGLAGGAVAELAHVYRQTLHWFAADDSAAYAPDRFPVFIWIYGDTQEDYFYGFPSLPGTATVKVASARYTAPTSPDHVDRDVPESESAAFYNRHVAGRLRGVGPRCARAASCLYTVTPDAGFIVDALPDSPGVLVASACSGHGFKHSAALGEILAARALAGGRPSPGPFGLGRYTPGLPLVSKGL